MLCFNALFGDLTSILLVDLRPVRQKQKHKISRENKKDRADRQRAILQTKTNTNKISGTKT